MRKPLSAWIVVAALATLPACHLRYADALEGHTGEADGTHVRAGFPDDRTTGPDYAGVNEAFLPPCEGASPSWTISTTRTIEDCAFIGIRIVVEAPDVVLRNMLILGNSPYIVRNKSTGLVVENSIIGPRADAVATGPQGQPCSASLGDKDFALRHSEVFGCADGLKVRNTVEVTGSYFHDLYKGCLAGCTHNDTVQFIEQLTLDSLTFKGNAAYGDPCTSNRHFQLKGADHARIEIRDNFFYGFHGITNIDYSSGGNRGTITGNVYAGTDTRGPFTSKADGSSMSPGLYTGSGMAGIEVTDNHFEDGSPAPDNGRAAPYRCVRG
jgi:hypothetical protein